MFKPLVLALGLFGVASHAHGQTTEHADLLNTWLARKVLAEDAQLASSNVGVAVKNGVVVLWGPVPTAAHALRAGTLLKTRAEFVEVRNELVVVPDEDPWLVPTHVAPRSSGVLAARIEDEQPATLKPQVVTKSLQQLVREVHESRNAYKSFAVTVEGSAIFVSGSIEQGELLQEFVRALAKLPNVERVVLQPK